MSQVIRALYSMDKSVQQWNPTQAHKAMSEHLEEILDKVKGEVSDELYEQLNEAILGNEEEWEIRGYELGFKLGLNLGIEVSK